MRVFVFLVSLFSFVSVSAKSITVLTHGSFDLSVSVVEQFTEQTGYDVHFLPAGDAGEALNRAILTKERPLGDVLFGVDGALLVRARAEGIFEPYESPELARVRPEFLVAGNIATPVTVGYLTPNIDVATLAELGIDVPSDFADLLKPEYAGMFTAQDPASSSAGFSFLLATIARFGDPKAGIEPTASKPGDPDSWQEFWLLLNENGVEITSGWTDGYYSLYSYQGGTHPIIASYASSPAFEVMYGPDEPFTPPVNMEGTGTAFEQVEYAGILRGANDVAGAQLFLDFLLSTAVQEDVPGRMSVYPVVTDANVPAEFYEYGTVVDGAILPEIPGEIILEHQDRWLAEWTETVLYDLEMPVQ